MMVPLPAPVKLINVVDEYPWTLTLLFLNVFFFAILFSQPGPVKDAELTEAFIQKAGHYYLEWQNKSQLGLKNLEIQSLGAQAIRDMDFIFSIESWKSKADPVGFTKWKQDFAKIFSEEENKPLHIFGLSQAYQKPITWLTYQFSHQNGYHLFSNMVLMIVFAAIVEKMVGGFLLGIIYLLGGFVGAYFFMRMDNSGLIPMVGASASVTALMGFVTSGSLKKNIPYFYFLSPFQGFYGKVYLSPLWVIPLFLISDLTEILSDPPGWGSGVAHSAHLGGAFAGLVLGIAFKYGSSRTQREVAKRDSA